MFACYCPVGRIDPRPKSANLSYPAIHWICIRSESGNRRGLMMTGQCPEERRGGPINYSDAD
jgi:hypothetical protein